MQDRYHVIAGPPMSPDGVSVEGLGALAAALNALDQPAAAALDDLQADMVELAFNSLAPKDRQRLLGRTGIRMAAPRRAGSALCRDVLARLRREARQHSCSCGVMALTQTVMNDVGRAAVAQSGAASDPVLRWGATLVRAAVFAWCNASVADAFVLVWAADRDWFGAEEAGTAETQRLDAVRAAARSVVEANEDFALGLHEAYGESGRKERQSATGQDRPAGVGRTGADATASDAVAPSSPAPDRPLPDQRAGRTSVWDGPVPDPPGAVTDATGPGDGADPEEVCRRLEFTLAEAGRAVRRVTVAVEDGRPPAAADLTPLTGLRAVFDSARTVLDAAGIAGGPLRLEDMARAAHEHRMERDRDRVARATLRDLPAISCREDSPAESAAEAVRSVARRLLGIPVWGETERRESAALTALADLVRLGRQAAAAAEILALQERVVRVLPACATAAVMAYELTLPGPTEVRSGPESSEPAGAASDRDAVADLPGTPYGGTGDAVADAAGPAADLARGEHVGAAPTERSVEGTVKCPAQDAAKEPAGDAETRRDAVPEAVALPETDSSESPPAEAPDAAPRPAPVCAGDEAAAADSHPGTVRTAPAVEHTVTLPTGTVGTPHDTEPLKEEADQDDDTASAGRVLARLVAERRFGLAHHVARAAGRPEPQAAALRLAGATALLTSGTSHGARLVADLLQQQSEFVGGDVEGNELVLLPALLRAALVTGDHLAGAQLKVMVPRLPDALGEVAAAVADRALSGALLIASPLVVIADASETEARLRELREQCGTVTAPQRLRFARATEIAKRWLAPDDGLLGSMLTAVLNNDRDALPAVREKAERLSKPSEINSEIDRMDREYRPSSGKPLQGSGRRDLVHIVERAVGLAKEWCLVADRARRGGRSEGNRAAKEISSLRQSMLARRDAVLTELERPAGRSGTAATAAAWAARSAMEELFALLSGGTGTVPPGSGADPELVLDAELLKVCDTAAEQPSLDGLLTAADRGWDEALRERLDRDAFTAARTMVELAARGALPASEGEAFGPQRLAEIEELETTRRTALRVEHDELVTELHRAQADGAVTDDQDLRLQELLADGRTHLDDTGHHDLIDVRRALETVRADLPMHRQEAADRIRARLDALDLPADERAQVLRHLDTGGLATAADLVYFLEIGEPVPEIEAGESHLTEFFPVVPEGLPKGIDHELVAMVRSGGKHPTVPVLDYGNLSSDEAALAADALNDWRELGATEAKDRPKAPAGRKLLPALKLLGYDAESARSLEELSPHRREYRFFEASGVEVNGRAKVPAFGSQIKEQGGNLRVLMLWGRPPAEVVMSLASRDTSETSLLVVYFGTLGREARAELAAGSDRLQPLLVVDDAALAYLAARGNRQASTATQTLLPFSGVNPYIREKRGRIGGEMFYGRDAERKSILDPRGTQVIFGGRGLGKSALLSDAGERFMDQRPGFHQSVYLNLDQENIGKGSSLGPEALWSVLDRELTDAQVLGRPQGRKSQKDRSERVREGTRSWLDGDSRRRLLILLDECDQFFEADAPRFDQTKKLKGLGSDTKDRAKVVFAGLHSVQRFSKLASNGPFGHLAQTPKVIGPLAPQFAADLLVEPMRALGFEFDDVDLVNRVLGYCSYQPFLLQMFGHRLVEVMHRKRARRGAEGPPYTVRVTDIEAVESDAALRTGISAAFKDTLSLDHRYDVIANVLAYQARNHGLEVRLSDAELREECETYWREGFRQLDTEGFRAYLSEMVGLGVLAPNHEGQGWHLRGPNALRMIGTSHEVETRLVRAEQDCKLEESIVLEGRPELPDGRPAPLTITQLDDLLGERANQTRVVLGTPATGVGDVGDTLRAVAGRIADWRLPPIGKPSVFKQELTGGNPRERRVLISDFARYPAKPETCREAVDLADALLPGTPGVTRAVVLVTDTGQLDLWRVLLTGEEHTTAVPVVLRRHDRRSLRGWAQRTEVFNTDERLDRLYTLTGGWPLLVDRAHQLYGELGDPEEVLRRLAGMRTDRSAARAFVEATGMYADPMLAAGYRSIVEAFEGDPADRESAVTAIVYKTGDEAEARWVFACLDALQVFDHEDDAQLRLEPLLRQCVELGE
ncbi:hypothetical protein [Streptomyces tubercidicus]|uniref:hypothetical protein n=1 Tax=Streptomyces tubercidicus TaxID=47759 RepID=UPI002E10DE29|nr:hypothetical protein OG761_08850 [Streptomyces tubercidicus]